MSVTDAMLATKQPVRAFVLRGRLFGTWEAGPRSAAELREAATHYERAAALHPAPAAKAEFAESADFCRAASQEGHV